MESRSRFILLPIVLSVYCFTAFSQRGSGYLFRCYVSTKLELKTLTNYDLFNCFLDIDDLRNEINDSVYYQPSREGSPFQLFFSNLFQKNLKLIDNVPRKEEILDHNCKLGKTISLKDTPLYDFIYTYKLTTEDFFYVVMVNKVSIEYCTLNQYTEYDLMFRQRVALKAFPCFLKLDDHEIDFFESSFQKSLNLKGQVFYRP